MADPNGFKLFRTVDPTTVNVPIKEKFAKLTLSSNKKQQLASKTPQQKPQLDPQSTRSNSNVSRQLLGELNDLAAVKSYEHPLLRSDSSSSHTMGQEHTPKAEDVRSQLDVSDYMEALQLSADGCTQQTVDVDVEALSTQVSNLTMQPEERLPQEQSICISSTTAESDDDDDDGSASCITISDSSESEHGQQEAAQNEPEPTSMTVSEQLPPTSILDLSNVKVQRIEAFLRDVSFERREIIRRGSVDMLGDITRLASADTESMSLGEIDCTELLSVSQHQADSSKRLADNETEINTICSVEQVDSSKRLADNETEVNTVCSEGNSKRLANDDTEVNTPNLEEPLSDVSGQQTTLDETIPETSSELEQTPPRPTSASSAEPEELEHTPAIQVSSINISAKINIKIHIPTMDSSSEAEQSIVETAATSEEGAEFCRQQEQEKEHDSEQDGGQEEELEHEQKRECSVLGSDASEDEQFLTQAEKLLNQLYGKSWQTPDVIRTLKRSSGSGGKTPSVGTGRRNPLTEIKRKPRQPIATPVEKAAPRTTAQANDSAVGDFSIFRRALNSNKFNSTHLPTATCSERRPNRPRVRTNHIDEERWRALIDTDSGTDASDDDDANATESSEDSVDEDGDEAKSDGRVIYLDLTKNEAEAFGSPDEPNTKSTPSPKRLGALEDILRTCRATTKSKLPATPTATTTPVNPIRRQLFTPNTGYEDPTEAKRIVDQALDLNSLDQLEIIYLPGSNVHKRIQEVKKQLGIGVQTPKAKPIFNLPTPKTAPPTRTMVRARKVMKNKNSKKSPPKGPYGFLKSLEPEVARELSDTTALFYRENFAKNKERLAVELYKMYNAKVFHNQLDVSIIWSARLRNTAGRCNNKRRMRVRSCVIELSTKVLTSADRLRCTLIHELCHAAAWIFNGAGGHGVVWRSWAERALSKFPELPPISVCHQYKIEYKFTYKCEACNMSLNAHSKSRKVDQYCCQICQGPIVVYRNKKTKLGGFVQTPVREATGFAKYVKDNFNKHKSANLTAAQVMRILSAEYAKEKNEANDNAESNDVAEQMDTLILDTD